MDVTRLEHVMSKFTHGEAGGIRRLPNCWWRTLDALGDYIDGLRTSMVFFKRTSIYVVISDK